MILDSEIKTALVAALDPEIKRAVADLVRGGARPCEIGAFIRTKCPTQPLTAQAAQCFAELCQVVLTKKEVTHHD